MGRSLLTSFSVVARCPDGHPLVIRNHPLDRNGKPFPTLFWLTCPQAVKAVSRLEADGWIKRLADRAESEAIFGDRLRRAHRQHAEERARYVPDAGEWGGVTGTAGGVKCLHAHYANHLAGGEDPIGAWVAERVEPIHRTVEGRVAAVDMGTNSIRLLVADPGDGDLREVARDMVITRIGEGVDVEGKLAPAALERTMDVLGWYARRARALRADRIRVAATSAVRDAVDRKTLFDRVRELTGVEPEVLSGEREAALSFLGATAGLEASRPFLVFDIGGGSTELALGSDAPEATASVDVGSVRITERVRPADPPTVEDVEAMRQIAGAALAEAEYVVAPGAAATLVGVAGTVTTVQALALGLERYDPEEIHRTVLSRAEAGRVTEMLAGLTIAERRALRVMAPGRADVIVAGCLILLEILDRWRGLGCIVSERDILDGLALELLTGPASAGYP